MSLFTTRQSAFSISQQGTASVTNNDNFSGPSDRAIPSVNPITGSVGVDKKHNSYARYLGRLKGPVLRADARYDLTKINPTLSCGDTLCANSCPPTT